MEFAKRFFEVENFLKSELRRTVPEKAIGLLHNY